MQGFPKGTDHRMVFATHLKSAVHWLPQCLGMNLYKKGILLEQIERGKMCLQFAISNPLTVLGKLMDLVTLIYTFICDLFNEAHKFIVGHRTIFQET